MNVLKQSPQRLGFLLCGYVLMPDHALIWPQYPALLWAVGISRMRRAHGSETR
jgi:hypothetical protein